MTLQGNAISRRSMLKGGGLVLSLPFTLGPIGRAAAAACSSVVVATWGGDSQKKIQTYVKPIVERDGIATEFLISDQVQRMTTLRAEKNSKHGSMDAVCLGDIDMATMNLVGVLGEIDESMVPNVAHIYPEFRKPYSVPYFYSALGLVCNETEGNPVPRSFAELLDPKYKGRVGFSDILFTYNILASALAAGGDGSSLDQGYEFLLKLKENQPKIYPSNEAVAAALKSGDIAVSFMWKARAIMWRKLGLSTKFVLPEEGGIPVTFEVAVAKNAPSGQCAFKFVDAMLDPTVQRAFSEAMGYASAVENANLPEELEKSVNFTEAERAKLMHIDLSVVTRQQQQMVDFWNRKFKVGL